MAHSKSNEPLYAAFRQFIDRCLIADQSLLWPETRVWTLENVSQVKKWVFDESVFDPTLSFEQKLMSQMQHGSSVHWMLIADLYYVYFLPSHQMSLKKRLHDIRWAAQHAGIEAPPENASVWQAQQRGFTRTGFRYHHKYRQFWLVLLFAEWIKGQSERQAILLDQRQVQTALDNMLETQIPDKSDRAYDMRSAILYLMFPDFYEPIISTIDKQQIIKTYGNRVGTISPDLDEALLAIRSQLSKELDVTPTDEPFRYHQEGMKEEWRPGSKASVGSSQLPPPLPVPTAIRPIQEAPLDDDAKAVLRAFDFTHNVILYGPPGTGKTFTAQRVAEELVRPQIKARLTEEARFQRAGEGLSFWERLAVSLYHSGQDKKYSVAEIQQQPLIRVYYRTSPILSEKQNIWNNLQTHTSHDSSTVKTSVRREPFIFDKDDQSRWFLTKSGVEYVAQNYADTLKQLQPDAQTTTSESFISWVTFHQSYSYEDFIEGLRPIPSEEGLTYEIVPGTFSTICERAQSDPQNKYILVIDEVNRGNIAKIFGELITLLEDDKRAHEGKGLYNVELTFSRNKFSVPDNLFVLGTMNTADRSIALLDIALRRRFAFVELLPRADLLGEVEVETAEISVPLRELLHNLNVSITKDLGREYQIGHSYFLKVAQERKENAVEFLEFVWRNQVLPLLKEYYYSQHHKLVALLRIPEADAGSDGGMAEVNVDAMTRDDLLAMLAEIASTKPRTGDNS